MHARPMVATGLATLAAIVLSGGAIQGASRDAPAWEAEVRSADQRKVALGVSMFDGRDLGELDDFRDAIGGRRVATWTIWSRWEDPTRSAFPMAAARAARARGAVPFIWWEPITPGQDDPTFSRHQNILDGLHDDYIRSFARGAKRFRDRVLLRFAHQANGDAYPWGWDSPSAPAGNTIRTFKAVWRHVHRIFRDVGARNVRFVWTVATQTCAGDGQDVVADTSNCLERRLGYPGRRYVDYVGFTWENWGDEPAGGSDVPDQPWVSMRAGFRPIVARLRVFGKPIIAAAIASGPDGGSKAAWIRRGYRAVHRSFPEVKAIMYLNVDLRGLGHRDWSLTGASLEAYAGVAALRSFRGRIP